MECPKRKCSQLPPLHRDRNSAHSTAATLVDDGMGCAEHMQVTFTNSKWKDKIRTAAESEWRYLTSFAVLSDIFNDLGLTQKYAKYVTVPKWVQQFECKNGLMRSRKNIVTINRSLENQVSRWLPQWRQWMCITMAMGVAVEGAHTSQTSSRIQTEASQI